MGRCGGASLRSRNDEIKVLSPRMTHGSITASGDFACPTTTRTSIPIATIEADNPVVIGDGERHNGLPPRSTDRRPDGLHGP